MSAKRKIDYSRMVALDLSPSEAADVAGVLMAMLSIDLKQRCLDEEQRLTVCGLVDRLNRQLKLLQWPGQKRAPYPI